MLDETIAIVGQCLKQPELIATEKPLPLWKRVARKIGEKLPLITKTCRFGHYHWRWEELCFHGVTVSNETWHHGILDMTSGVEFIPCAQCIPSYGLITHTWHLSKQEEALVASWRLYANRYTNGKEPEVFRVVMQEGGQNTVLHAQQPTPSAAPTAASVGLSPSPMGALFSSIAKPTDGDPN